MGRAEDIYKRIVDSGIDAIRGFIETRATEELFLDFKRSSSAGAGKNLSADDRKSLSKAISGFGNSEGGVIVWGIDCRNLHGGGDCANALFPLENPMKFKGWVESAISGCTVPPHPNIMNHVVLPENGQGYVATYIAKSDHAPHQVTGEGKYYIRAGSSFHPAPHGVLEGMFGRRPQPHIYYDYGMPWAEVMFGCVTLGLEINLWNNGPGVATDCYMNLLFSDNLGPGCQVVIDAPDKNVWMIQHFYSIHYSVITQPQIRIPPEFRLIPFSIKFIIQPPFTNDLTITGMCGSGQSLPQRFKIKNDKNSIMRLYDEIIAKNSSGAQTEDLAWEFTRRFFNLEDNFPAS